MPTPTTLSKAPLDHPAMDFEFLRQEGIRHLERLAGDLWTDYNTHDPGITILEQVSYALTDLANRIHYSMPDLLAGGSAHGAGSLYTAAQILTSAPVTLEDLRKLVIDVEGVKNAWVVKVEAHLPQKNIPKNQIPQDQTPPIYFDASKKALTLKEDRLLTTPVTLRGLYRVLVEMSDLLYLEGASDQAASVAEEVAKRLHANRGLCEDIEAISILEPEYIRVRASIEIEAVEDAESIMLRVYQCLGDSISPPIRTATLAELLAAGKRSDEIFDGPLLEHGFIDSDALKNAGRKDAIRISDLIQEIMDVPGVRAVRTVAVSNGGSWEEWSLTLNAEQAPKLDVQNSTISLERNRLPTSIDVDSVRRNYFQMLRDADLSRTAGDIIDLPIPKGRNRNVGKYYSIQYQFPDNYGIGTMGLPDSAPMQRKAQAKQLQAYLLFFDQLLANYFSQLAHMSDLFSFSDFGKATRTYFSQPITDPELGLDGIRASESAEHAEKLQQMTENPDDPSNEGNLLRRNRFLNHLLARFAEQFTDYSLVLFGAQPKDGAAPAEKLVFDKQAFLADYPKISSRRGASFNYLKPPGPENISGLERRLQRLLGFGGEDSEERFFLVEHILLRPMQGDVAQSVPILAASSHKDPYSLQISFVFPEWPKRFQDPGFRAFIERTLREETPAHLHMTTHWLDKTAMEAFETAYLAWVEKRRIYWAEQLGV